MKILALIDSFKGSMNSQEIKEIVEQSANKHNHMIKAIPMSDGGEGFLDTISYILNKKAKHLTINTFNKTIKMPYLINDNKVYLEVASIVGINLLNKEELDPYINKTTALGDVLKDFYHKGYKDFIIGLGGTATNDFGLGLIQSLGAKIYLNNEVVEDVEIKDLNKVTKIDIETLLKYKDLNIKLITDVKNTSFGKNGATKTFAGQKGLNKKDFNSFEKLLKNYVNKLIKAGALDARKTSGSGAAGGLGFIFLSLFNSNVLLGANYILELLKFKELSSNYDLIITGEGKVDKQSLDGKVVFEVLKQTNKQTIIVCGVNELNIRPLKRLYNNLVDILPIVPNITTLEQSLNSKKYFEILINRLFNYIK